MAEHGVVGVRDVAFTKVRLGAMANNRQWFDLN